MCVYMYYIICISTCIQRKLRQNPAQELAKAMMEMTFTKDETIFEQGAPWSMWSWLSLPIFYRPEIPNGKPMVESPHWC